ncbi:hypothetical protein ACFYU9_13655 [Streptomyces sp. NPDC004327]|uniref:hypothetical protein n=1 Tax=Streptomyces sp. NPDC004327 TaxID=3364699 RepID=UPI0036AD99CE
MADERYAWLDREAAERLLRGEPVDPADAAGRDQARLLARALDSARTPPAAAGPDGELPGEAAALAAFRKATAERAAVAAEQAAPGQSGYADLGAVRLAPVTTGSRWGRSLRYGLAAAFAAVTVGGVAVAAGTGVLPLTRDPDAGRSVNAVDTTDPTVSGSPTGGIGTEVPAVPSTGPGRTTAPGSTDGPDATTAGPGGGTATPGGTGTGGQGGVSAAERDRVLKACQDFRSGKLADSGRQRLAEALKSGDTVKRYCDRVLSGVPVNTATPSTGRTSSGSANGGSGNGSGKGAGTGKGSGSGSDTGNADGDDKSDRGDRKRDRGGDREGDRNHDRNRVGGADGAHGQGHGRSRA